jgi:hypothetical protein
VSPGRRVLTLATVGLPLAWASASESRAAGAYLQLELGVMPRTVIDAEAGEHVKIDTIPAPTGTVAAGWVSGAWRVQLALGLRYLNTDGVLDARFQTNGSLTLWPVLLEALRDLDLAPRTGLPLEAFAGLGGGAAYADLHDFAHGNGGEVVPVASAQLGLGWHLRPALTLLAGGRGLLTGTFDSPSEKPGAPHTRGRLAAAELFAGLRLGF